MIRHLGLSGFFLLHREMLELAREVAREVRGPDAVRALLPPGRGRGSSVASIVCYLTGLSHVDPVEKELHLGRFLNEELTALPDIDLDFPRDIREKLIPRVHERYGPERAALVGGAATYQVRGAVRDFAKALGLPPGEIERLARVVDPWKAGDIDDDVKRRRRARGSARPRWPALVRLVREADGPAAPPHAAPRRHGHLDRAAGGPLPDPAVRDGGPADGPVGQGLLRRRRLPQDRPARAWGCSRRSSAAWRRSRGRAASASTSRASPTTTREVYDMIQRAETTGVFQIESRAQMQMLPRTRPESLDDLTVQVALVRPGPIQGGAVHPYIAAQEAAARGPRRTRSPTSTRRSSRCCATRSGAIVFQDQVIEVAMAFAGFSAGEAEGLRRAMSRKRSEAAMRSYEQKFIEGAVARGASSERSPSGCTRRSWASRASASPSRTRRRSGCSPTSRPGCACTTGRSSSARC